jgi:DNA polymerase I-like protein with 3'-5' exonuclease and polymerase domains
VVEFTSRYIFDDPPPLLSFDIETASKTITCIGFSPNENLSLTIPFFDPAKPDHNYWPDAATEKKVWLMIKRVMESDIRKLGQNGLYDIQYLYRHGIKVRNYAEDTMIKHHSLYPELSKGLGFLGSIYTDEAPWKLLRARNKEQFKLEDE